MWVVFHWLCDIIKPFSNVYFMKHCSVLHISITLSFSY